MNLPAQRDPIWNEASDRESEENSVAEEIAVMKGLNDIITEQQ